MGLYRCASGRLNGELAERPSNAPTIIAILEASLLDAQRSNYRPHYDEYRQRYAERQPQDSELLDRDGTGSERGLGILVHPPGAPDLLSLPDRIPQRRLHHRARHLVSAHLEDGCNSYSTRADTLAFSTSGTSCSGASTVSVPAAV